MVEIAVDGDRIVLQKHTPRCVFCSRSEALVEYHNRRICASCMRELSAMGGGTKVARRRTGGLNRSVSPLAAPKRRKSNEGYPGLFLPGRHRHADPA